MMRGSDGRSLSLALAALLFLNTLLAGLHAGFAAETAPGARVLCSVTEPAHAPGQPAGHDHDCCLAASTPPTLPMAPVFHGPRWAAAVDVVRPAPRVAALPARLVLAHEGPRGPPVLA